MSETELPVNGHSGDGPANGGAAARRRKRVVAREVDAADVEVSPAAGPGDSALLPAPVPEADPDFIIHIPDSDRGIEPVPPAPEHDPTPVLDPTLLGQRQRHRRHHRVYRWTQMLSIVCALAAIASVICTMVDEPLAGRIVAAPAVLAGLVAVILSSRNGLAARWRGYAVAALVFAVVALGITWLHGLVT